MSEETNKCISKVILTIQDAKFKGEAGTSAKIFGHVQIDTGEIVIDAETNKPKLGKDNVPVHKLNFINFVLPVDSDPKLAGVVNEVVRMALAQKKLKMIKSKDMYTHISNQLMDMPDGEESKK